MDATPTDLRPLRDGITLLETDTTTFRALVLDHLVIHGGTARWIEGRERAADLARAGTTRRMAARIRVTGAATARRHAGAVAGLPTAISHTDTVLALPGFSLPYEAVDPAREAEDLLHGSLRALHETALARGIPALVTAPDAGGALHHVVAAEADHVLRPRRDGGGRERSAVRPR